MKYKAMLLLGTNLGDKHHNLLAACEFISKDLGLLSNHSSIYKTAAWGKTEQPEFLNQVVEIETAMIPQALLKACLSIEKQMGRLRMQKWGERIIDIDILYFDNEIMSTPELTIPHPGIQHRRFTLTPLAEMAPNYLHPVLHKTHQMLLQDCDDNLEVEVYLTQN